MDDNCTCGKSRVRSEEEMRRLCNRLSRIEGQVRGLRETAANAALNAFSRELLSQHLRTCVAENLREGNDEVIDELVAVLQKLMK